MPPPSATHPRKLPQTRESQTRRAGSANSLSAAGSTGRACRALLSRSPETDATTIDEVAFDEAPA
jgi:hypothetical protein